jgi:predicted enzyme related to lactoylglutathione lyase
MPRVGHFLVNADNPERARIFYEKVFGWEFSKWDGPIDYWMINTGGEDEPGIDGGLLKRQDPNSKIENVIEVPSVDEYMKRVKEKGGTLVSPTKMPIPGVGYIAWFRDTEGNVLGIMETDETDG